MTDIVTNDSSNYVMYCIGEDTTYTDGISLVNAFGTWFQYTGQPDEDIQYLDTNNDLTIILV